MILSESSSTSLPIVAIQMEASKLLLSYDNCLFASTVVNLRSPTKGSEPYGREQAVYSDTVLLEINYSGMLIDVL